MSQKVKTQSERKRRYGGRYAHKELLEKESQKRLSEKLTY